MRANTQAEAARACVLTAEGRQPRVLRIGGPGANVRLTVGDIHQRLVADIPDRFLDLLDLAAYVYAGDQAVKRGDLSAPGAPGWRRLLRYRAPVRDPGFWAGAAVRDALVQTLSFLSDDEYDFEFVPLDDPPPVQQYLEFTGTPFDDGVDEVMLFSGGLDSLGGAVREAVVDRRTVALVHHRSTGKDAGRHDELVRRLAERAGGSRVLHFPVVANKAKGLGREHTQRTRSFLFAALGGTMAVMLGLSRVRFYENGVLSLNLPVSGQVVGARASRTTHPLVLRGYADILSLAADRPFAVENPFQWLTKTEVVRGLAEAGCGELIGLTRSCAHTWTRTKEHPHCGSCSQCLDRRFAVLAAGADAHDPADRYAIDLFVGARPGDEPRTMLAGYVETANQVERMTPVEFFSRFGEAARAVRHLAGVAGSAAEAGRLVFDMYRRHARQVTGVIDQALGRHAAMLRRRELSPDCLLRLVADGGSPAEANGAALIPPDMPRPDRPPPAVETTAPAAENVFRRNGRLWTVRYAGGTPFLLTRSKGARYLHQLLSRPGVGIGVAELVAADPEQLQHEDPIPKSDHETLRQYRNELREMDAALDRARQDNDDGAVRRLEADRACLLERLRQDCGPGGRLQSFASNRDRLRKAVQNAIRRAVTEIEESDPRLAAHLVPPTLRCGYNPCYCPADGARWET